MQEKVKAICEEYEPKFIEYRRNIHKIPELAFKEFETQAYVKKVLNELGIEHRDIGTGVVGIIRGSREGRCIALRADMDALPMTERTNLPFSSKTEGVMHACGHDVHTAILLGAAHVLSKLKDEIKGSVKLVFQPAEESNPDCGAKQIIQGGAFKNPDIDGILGLHVWPGLETGVVSTKVGPVMSASDRINIVIKGKSSHGSEPDKGIDAIMIGSQVVTALQSIVSRSVSPLIACVISIGTMKAGYRYNIIADRTEMEGTVRNVDPGIRERMPERIENLIKGICISFGADYEFDYQFGYSPLVNEATQTRKVIAVLRNLLGDDRFVDLEKPSMGGEDFSFYAKEAPTTFLLLGCRPKDVLAADFAPLHNACFSPDENCMGTGVSVMAHAALELLGV